MKKIERIQIAGHSFFFEDDAFSVLDNFIGQIHRLYKDNGEDLKVAEVENRIAEMCYGKVGEDGIVTTEIISEIISVIGIKIEEPVIEEPVTDSDGDDTKTDGGDSEQNCTWYKAMLKGSKLFRNKHGNILGGVLSGIAVHYDIDVTALRVIALLMFILPLPIPVAFVYLIFWIVLPKATTIMDYTRMRRVKANGDVEAVKQAWKKNYDLCVEELSTPADKGCLYSFVRILFFILLAIMIMPLAVVIFALLLILFILVVLGCGFFEVFNLSFMLFVGVVAVIVIPIFSLFHFLLKKVNLCKPMKKGVKVLLWSVWVIALLLTAPVVHDYIQDHGGYRNIENIIEFQLENMEAFFNGDIKDIALMTGSVNYSSGSLYNLRHIDSDCDAVIAATWDAEREGLPLIIESIHGSDGEYAVTFYTHGNDFAETHEKLLDEDFDARVEARFSGSDEVRGWHCFAWDSISRTVYYGGYTYEAPNQMLQSVETEEQTSKIKLCNMSDIDGLTYDNACEKGLIPFKIFYYGNQRTPSLVVGHDENGEVQEIATLVKLKSRYCAKFGDNFTRNIKIDKDVTDKIDNLLNDIADDVDNIADKVDAIVDASENVVEFE